eukprot:5721272-Ditylum_brightwellii.AAC.1
MGDNDAASTLAFVVSGAITQQQNSRPHRLSFDLPPLNDDDNDDVAGNNKTSISRHCKASFDLSLLHDGKHPQ